MRKMRTVVTQQLVELSKKCNNIGDYSIQFMGVLSELRLHKWEWTMIEMNDIAQTLKEITNNENSV